MSARYMFLTIQNLASTKSLLFTAEVRGGFWEPQLPLIHDSQPR